jgi:hypothetical protein
VTRKYKGHYSSKHPGESPDPVIARHIESRAGDDGLPCAVAIEIARELKVAPLEVGKTADLLDVPVIKCQLGLFGYQPNKRIVKPAPGVPQDLKEEILKGLVDDRLPCKTIWEIAERRGIRVMEVSSACETLKIKIKPCRLGSF